MLPVLIGGAIGFYASLKLEEKKARDQKAFDESAGDAIKSFREGNYTETQGMFDDVDNADSDDGSLENSLLELLSLEDGKNLSFVLIKKINGEDSLVFGLYDTKTQAIDTDSIELSRIEQAVVRDSLVNGTYDLETVGKAENIRVISMED
jgi:methionine synthase II (cobalamin-independent)